MMKMKKCPAVAIMMATLVMGAAAAVEAVEIPLERGTIAGTAAKESAVMGYVDIEKIFDEHPMKKRLQAEYQEELEKRKKDIAESDKAISDLEKVIVSSSTEINRAKLEIDILRSQINQAALSAGTTDTMPAQSAGAAVSTATVRGGASVIQVKETALKEKESGLETLKKELDAKKDALVARIKQNKADLAQLEEKNTAEVLADLYQVLQKVANDEGVTIVIDKNDVLYGQSGRDLTDKVRERLQGR